MFRGIGDLEIYRSPEHFISVIQPVYKNHKLFRNISDSSSCYVGLSNNGYIMWLYLCVFCCGITVLKEDLIEW